MVGLILCGGRFIHCVPVLSCESKNGGFGRNDNKMDSCPPQHRAGSKNNIKNQNAKCKDTNQKLNFRRTTPKQAWGLNKRTGR